MNTNETDLASFIAKSAKPYDPNSDEYNRSSFAAPIKAGKNTAIYNAHSYHTKVPPLGIVPYIEHYTSPGDLVLDPFCGSGMTGIAALMTGRNIVLNDLSPAAAHITYNYCTPVDVTALKREFERIQIAVQEEFAWLYGTICDQCGGPATIQYTLWSDIFECGRCGFNMVLWETAFDQDSQSLAAQFTCPSCGKEWRKAQLRRSGVCPVRTGYECRGKCKPKRKEHPPTQQELQLIKDIEQKSVPYWYPRTPLIQTQRCISAVLSTFETYRPLTSFIPSATCGRWQDFGTK